jgi:hypothetical protein
VVRLIAVGVLFTAFTAFAACALLDDGPPDNRCASNQDCFRAQGEVCNLEKHVCELATVDAGIDAP